MAASGLSGRPDRTPLAGFRSERPIDVRALRARRRAATDPQRIAQAAADALPTWQNVHAMDWEAAVAALRARLRAESFTEIGRADALACAAQACTRALGLTPRANQLLAAAALLDQRLVEMASGEGKTLAVACAAAVAALAGVPVHAITAHDHLARGDAESLAPMLGLLGLTAAAVHAGMPPAARPVAWRADVVYCSARELVLDYVQDGWEQRPRGREGERDASPSPCRPGGLRARGLCMALIDEADYILLDEALVPVVVPASRGGGLGPGNKARPAAGITYQRFFPRYHRLAGIGGTLREAARELRRTYGLAVFGVPGTAGRQRERWPTRVWPSAVARRESIVARVWEMRAIGRPVLIGTDSVVESRAVSVALEQAGIPHAVMDACQDANEARVAAAAGQRGAVTVATGMAGCGTDVTLGEGVGELGGLHVLCCLANPVRRLDRQFEARCARQQDPGSFEHWIAPRERSRVGAERPIIDPLRRCLYKAAVVPGGSGMLVAAFRIRQRLNELHEAWLRARAIRLDVGSAGSAACGAHRD